MTSEAAKASTARWSRDIPCRKGWVARAAAETSIMGSSPPVFVDDVSFMLRGPTIPGQGRRSRHSRDHRPRRGSAGRWPGRRTNVPAGHGAGHSPSAFRLLTVGMRGGKPRMTARLDRGGKRRNRSAWSGRYRETDDRQLHIKAGRTGTGAPRAARLAVAARPRGPEQADCAAPVGTTAEPGPGGRAGRDDPAVHGIPGKVPGAAERDRAAKAGRRTADDSGRAARRRRGGSARAGAPG